MAGKKQKYLYHDGDCLEIRPVSPEMKFIFQVSDAKAVRGLDSIHLRENLFRLTETSGEKKGKIIRLRFGLENGEPMTLAEVGEKCGVTKQYIDLVEDSELPKMAEHLDLLLAKKKELPVHQLGKNYVEKMFIEDLHKYLNHEPTILFENILQNSQVTVEISAEQKEKSLLWSENSAQDDVSMQLIYLLLTELDLSAGTIKKLSDAGFVRTGEVLNLSDDELKAVLNESETEEFRQKISEMKFRLSAKDVSSDDQYTLVKIKVSAGRRKQVRTFHGCVNENEIGHQMLMNLLYEALSDRSFFGGNIFNTDFPLKMQNALLLNGWFYLRDILENISTISLYFENTDMASYADILRNFTSGFLCVKIADESTADFMERYKISTFHELQRLRTENMTYDEQKMTENLRNWCAVNMLYAIEKVTS